jgi:mannose-6-phosphate isomerase
LKEEKRPWGMFEVLMGSDNTPKVKRITVKPTHKLSLQKHKLRDEHWFILQGSALVTIGSDFFDMSKGECVDIKRGLFHRIENIGRGDLIFIEIQTGEYFGEDDIERIVDEYGRV